MLSHLGHSSCPLPTHRLHISGVGLRPRLLVGFSFPAGRHGSGAVGGRLQLLLWGLLLCVLHLRIRTCLCCHGCSSPCPGTETEIESVTPAAQSHTSSPAPCSHVAPKSLAPSCPDADCCVHSALPTTDERVLSLQPFGSLRRRHGERWQHLNPMATAACRGAGGRQEARLPPQHCTQGAGAVSQL